MASTIAVLSKPLNPRGDMRPIFTRLPTLLLIAAVGVGTLACETGFGKPCKLPKSPAFREACEQSAGSATPEGGEETEGETTQESASSCAVKDYAGCETRVCLVYQGSSPFCSESCETDDDCEGSAKCRSLTGGSAADCKVVPGAPIPECYCVRKGDVADEIQPPTQATPTPTPAAGGSSGAGGTAAP
jgi:hypothetical protein